MTDILSRIVVILYRPQKLVNIGSTIRAMKNMGFERLRLVAPEAFDPQAIDAIAHRSQDILSTTEIFADLDTALADTTFVVGTTARPHGTRLPPSTPREIAPTILTHTQQGSVALLFGPEDNGLSNTELDRCHQLITIPTETGYPSLNLAQAVLIVLYELRHTAIPAIIPASQQLPANTAQLEQFFTTLEQALFAIQFFKTEHTANIMQTLRSITYRATPNTREVALLTAIAREISHYTRRTTGGI